MQKNKTKNKKIIFPGNQGGKITVLILATIILVVVTLGATFTLGKSSLKAALTKAADTEIQIACADVKTTNSKGKMYPNCVVGPNDAIHITMRNVLGSDTDSELWSNDQCVYHRDNGKVWNYIRQNVILNEVYSGYEKLYTAHNLKQFSDDASRKLKLKSNGFSGYVISYHGNDEDVIKNMQKAASVAPTSNLQSGNVKGIELRVKVNRKKELTDFYYEVTYYNRKGGALSLHLCDVNQARKLKIPASVTKDAKKLNIKSN